MQLDLDVTGSVDDDTLSCLNTADFIATHVDKNAIYSMSTTGWGYYNDLVDISGYLVNNGFNKIYISNAFN